MKKILLLSTLLLALTSCSKKELSEESSTPIPGRWYTQEQVNLGKVVFQNNCAVCHGKNAEQTINWKQTLSDGSYPPPPLNGTAHAWHHPLSVLKMTINEGGAKFGGKMPGFKSILKDKEKEAAIAFFQNFWSDEIYNAWLERGGLQ
jgi:mono/diheme cytochrome c family protein